MARLVLVWMGAVRLGKAGVVRRGVAEYGGVRQARHGLYGHGADGHG